MSYPIRISKAPNIRKVYSGCVNTYLITPPFSIIVELPMVKFRLRGCGPYHFHTHIKYPNPLFYPTLIRRMLYSIKEYPRYIVDQIYRDLLIATDDVNKFRRCLEYWLCLRLARSQWKENIIVEKRNTGLCIYHLEKFMCDRDSVACDIISIKNDEWYKTLGGYWRRLRNIEEYCSKDIFGDTTTRLNHIDFLFENHS